MSRYDLDRVTVKEILTDPEVVAIVERHRPGLASSQDARSVADLSVSRALELARAYATPSQIAAGRAELEALQ